MLKTEKQIAVFQQGVSFSVVIATFRRGTKIQATLQSVANQSLQDFEVLVVSDGPAEARLRKTVRSFGKHFRLLELPQRSRSQSAPNNVGWSEARGTYVAYLGHDDVWHPDHLRSLEHVFRKHPNASFAVSGCLMIGPPGKRDEFTWITGMFSTPDAPLEHFFPPSSIAHRNDPQREIPAWPEPMKNRGPVDSVFQRSAFLNGHIFYSTERVTVFKFNSALRYLSYLQPDDREQRVMLALTRSPEQLNDFVFRREELAKSQGTFMHLRHPDPSKYQPGEIVRGYETIRGIDIPQVESVTELRTLEVTGDALGFDWYASEGEPPNTWRWSGPSERPRFAIPLVHRNRVEIKLYVSEFITDRVRESLTIRVNGHRIKHVTRATQEGSRYQITFIAKLNRARGSVLELDMPETVSPEELGQSQDSRKLGLCLTKIEVSPVSGSTAQTKFRSFIRY